MGQLRKVDENQRSCWRQKTLPTLKINSNFRIQLRSRASSEVGLDLDERQATFLNPDDKLKIKDTSQDDKNDYSRILNKMV